MREGGNRGGREGGEECGVTDYIMLIIVALGNVM